MHKKLIFFIILFLFSILTYHSALAFQIEWIDFSLVEEKCFVDKYGNEQSPYLYECTNKLRSWDTLSRDNLYLIRFSLDTTKNVKHIQYIIHGRVSDTVFHKGKILVERKNIVHFLVRFSPDTERGDIEQMFTIKARLIRKNGEKSRPISVKRKIWTSDSKTSHLDDFPSVTHIDLDIEKNKPFKKRDFVLRDVIVTQADTKDGLKGDPLILQAEQTYDVCFKYTNTKFNKKRTMLVFSLMPDGAPTMEEEAFLPSDPRPQALQSEQVQLKAADTVKETVCLSFTPDASMAGNHYFFKLNLHPGIVADKWVRIKVENARSSNDNASRVNNATLTRDMAENMISAGDTHSLVINGQGAIMAWGGNDFGKVTNSPEGLGFQAVSAGLRHSLAIKPDGSLLAWGKDYEGSVLDTPKGTSFKVIAAGTYHSLALRNDGGIAVWGGDHTGVVSQAPKSKGFIDVAAGDKFSLALTKDGRIRAWGKNFEVNEDDAPSDDGFKDIAAGRNNGAAIDEQGEIIVWGDDDFGQVSDAPRNKGYVSIEAGFGHFLALHKSGKITAWGMDRCDQVTSYPKGTDFVAISAGHSHNIALRSDGTIEAWGNNENKQVSRATDNVWKHIEGGLPGDFKPSIPINPMLLDRIACGGDHSLLLASNGTLISHGWDNTSAQVTDKPSGHDFIAVSAAFSHSFALKLDGSINAWGEDKYSQVSNVPKNGKFQDIAAGGRHGVALSKDGEIIAWGDDQFGQVSGVPKNKSYIDVAAGFGHSIAIAEDGSLDIWGRNDKSQARDIPKGKSFVAIDGGFGHSVALTAEGDIEAWGSDKYGQVSETPSLGSFVAVAAGDQHNVALACDGSLVSWGRNDFNQVSETPEEENFVAVAAGQRHSLALKSNGDIVYWGDSRYGDVSWSSFSIGNIHGDRLISSNTVDAGTSHDLVVAPDGTIVAWGGDRFGQVSDTPHKGEFVQVEAGESHSLALKKSGAIVAWGNNQFGQISDTPKERGFKDIAAGSSHNIAIVKDGSLIAWGNDKVKQVSSTPWGNGYQLVAGGGSHSAVIKNNGEIDVWGDNKFGQEKAPHGHDFIDLAAGGVHTIALRLSGQITAWGNDRFGQVSDAPVQSNFVAIAAGMFHNLALKADGTLVSWGNDQFGQVSETPHGRGFVAIAADGSHSVAIKDDGEIVVWGTDKWGQISEAPAYIPDLGREVRTAKSSQKQDQASETKKRPKTEISKYTKKTHVGPYTVAVKIGQFQGSESGRHGLLELFALSDDSLVLMSDIEVVTVFNGQGDLVPWNLAESVLGRVLTHSLGLRDVIPNTRYHQVETDTGQLFSIPSVFKDSCRASSALNGEWFDNAAYNRKVRTAYFKEALLQAIALEQVQELSDSSFDPATEGSLLALGLAGSGSSTAMDVYEQLRVIAGEKAAASYGGKVRDVASKVHKRVGATKLSKAAKALGVLSYGVELAGEFSDRHIRNRYLAEVAGDVQIILALHDFLELAKGVGFADPAMVNGISQAIDELTDLSSSRLKQYADAGASAFTKTMPTLGSLVVASLGSGSAALVTREALELDRELGALENVALTISAMATMGNFLKSHVENLAEGSSPGGISSADVNLRELSILHRRLSAEATSAIYGVFFKDRWDNVFSVAGISKGIGLSIADLKASITGAGVSDNEYRSQAESRIRELRIDMTLDDAIEKYMPELQDAYPDVKDASVKSPAPSLGDVWVEPVTGMEFIYIPKGCFQMGSPDGSQEERPVHGVCLDGFWMSRFEVTNGQFRQFDADHDSGAYKGFSLNGDKQPALNVSWNEAREFAQWLSGKQQKNKTLKLPTEAQWEYAARGRTKSERFWGGDPDNACSYANVADRSAKEQWPDWPVHECRDGFKVTAPVGSFSPNDFGLYDMLGNAWEWCRDAYTENAYTVHSQVNPVVNADMKKRCLRGGSWYDMPSDVRSGARGSNVPNATDPDLGLRLVVRSFHADSAYITSDQEKNQSINFSLSEMFRSAIKILTRKENRSVYNVILPEVSELKDHLRIIQADSDILSSVDTSYKVELVRDFLYDSRNSKSYINDIEMDGFSYYDIDHLERVKWDTWYAIKNSEKKFNFDKVADAIERITEKTGGIQNISPWKHTPFYSITVLVTGKMGKKDVGVIFMVGCLANKNVFFAPLVRPILFDESGISELHNGDTPFSPVDPSAFSLWDQAQRFYKEKDLLNE